QANTSLFKFKSACLQVLANNMYTHIQIILTHTWNGQILCLLFSHLCMTMYPQLYVCAHTDTHTHTHTHTHPYTHTHTHAHTRTHTNTHTHIHIHMHTHTLCNRVIVCRTRLIVSCCECVS